MAIDVQGLIDGHFHMLSMSLKEDLVKNEEAVLIDVSRKDN